jgi:hypothetical protein
MHRSLALVGISVALTACSGGGHKAPAPPDPKAALEAARACRMWTETVAKFIPSKGTPPYAALDAMATAIGPVANQANADDARWAQLALDMAGATDFQSAAMPDVNQRIVADCKAVPATATKAAAAEPDPFTTVATSASTTTPARTTPPTPINPTTTAPTTTG